MSISVAFGPASQGSPLDGADIGDWTRRACLVATRAIVNSTDVRPPHPHGPVPQAKHTVDPRKPYPALVAYVDTELPRTPDSKTLVLTITRNRIRHLDDSVSYNITVSLCFKEILEGEMRRNEIFQHPDPSASELQFERDWRIENKRAGPETHELSFPSQPWSLPWYTNGIKREDFSTNTDWEQAMLWNSSPRHFKETARLKRACPVLGAFFEDASIDEVNSQAISFVSQKIREIASHTRFKNRLWDRASQPEFHRKIIMRDKSPTTWIIERKNEQDGAPFQLA